MGYNNGPRPRSWVRFNLARAFSVCLRCLLLCVCLSVLCVFGVLVSACGVRRCSVCVRAFVTRVPPLPAKHGERPFQTGQVLDECLPWRQGPLLLCTLL